MSKKLAKKPGKVEMVKITVEVPKNMYQDYLAFLRNYRIKPEEHLRDIVLDACVDSFDHEYMVTTLLNMVERIDAGYANIYERYLAGEEIT